MKTLLGFGLFVLYVWDCLYWASATLERVRELKSIWWLFGPPVSLIYGWAAPPFLIGTVVLPALIVSSLRTHSTRVRVLSLLSAVVAWFVLGVSVYLPGG